MASSFSSAVNQTHINGQPIFGLVPPLGHSAFPHTAAIDKLPHITKPIPEVSIVFLYGIHDRKAETIAIDIHSTLFRTNQVVQPKLADTIESNAPTRATVEPLKDKPGFQSWFLEGGEVKEDGVRKDGGAFWTMSKMGVPPLGFPGHQVKREEVSMCDATVAQVNWGSVEVDQRGREVWVVGLREYKMSEENKIVNIVVHRRAVNEVFVGEAEKLLGELSCGSTEQMPTPRLMTECILEPSLAEVATYSPYTQTLWLVKRLEKHEGADHRTAIWVHGLLTTPERGNIMIEE
ncbi:hypothetical protein B0J14DRAFT_560463 [Halenospora varia]|nr:hypothetical protein B0J14DRAFT_560463 [Halenospora varia]